MARALAQRLAANAPGQRPTRVRAVALAGGVTVFLGVVPWLLLRWASWLTHDWVVGCACSSIPQIVLGALVEAAGLALLAWVVVLQWRRGRGTPVPWVPTQELLVEGPYRYCRNPMQLGAGLYYFGLTLVLRSPMEAVLVWVVAMACGTLYHRGVEEQELLLRFGDAYRDYRARTPFLFPRRPW